MYFFFIHNFILITGIVKTVADCDSSICILNVISSMHEDMRLIRLNSNCAVSNYTARELCIATLAVPENTANVNLPNDLTPYSLNVLPSEDQKQATPIIQWHYLECESTQPLALYLSFSIGHEWSCPVRVDKGIIRR